MKRSGKSTPITGSRTMKVKATREPNDGAKMVQAETVRQTLRVPAAF
jgi:hypothetical protein